MTTRARWRRPQRERTQQRQPAERCARTQKIGAASPGPDRPASDLLLAAERGDPQVAYAPLAQAQVLREPERWRQALGRKTLSRAPLGSCSSVHLLKQPMGVETDNLTHQPRRSPAGSPVFSELGPSCLGSALSRWSYRHSAS